MRRVFGIETEYGLALSKPLAGEIEKVARALFLPLKHYQNSSNAFLENGGRLYLDVGWHPEYASAECDLLGDILAQDSAGDQLLNNLLAALDPSYSFSVFSEQVPQTFFASGVEKENLEIDLTQNRIHIFKNNLDYENNSYGCHENYLLTRTQDFRKIADSLVTFLVTRSIMVGAGHYGSEGEWVFSQRAQTITQSVSPTSTHTRPIINTRDEALADATKYRRLHVILGDSNLAESTNLLKISSTYLVINALEQGLSLTDLELKDPVAGLYAVAKDPWALLETKTGKSYTAVEIQREILTRLQHKFSLEKHVESLLPPGLTPELRSFEQFLWQESVALWEKTLNCFWRNSFEIEDFNPIATEIDWVIKKNLLESTMGRYQLTPTDPRITRLELAYHDITRAGLRKQLRECGKMRTILSQDSCISSCSVAPKTTRAHLRGKIITLAKAKKRDLSVDWLHLRVNGSDLETITLCDPFDTDEKKIEELLADLEE